ncbi:ATP-binding protein [Ktedonobacter robiniae]|uniref:ATP-binding protein n=1 Tax=Ktedonobacter robiniae TaxID=2778365 RepID=A0ABQ3UI02_9CHLR|nr:ATP-binding protein [Ktedonobacter robiniae]GHO52346.1 ATP-binding protein [Ktedonobacter robiniae]
MRVAFVGKGGSGKTTLSSLLCRYLASGQWPVMAMDADINQHLGMALGLSETETATLVPMGLEIERIKAYVRGSNPRLPSTALMLKTTPPGTGSRLLRLDEPNTLWEHFAREVAGVRLLVTGPFSQEDLGHRCYHSKVGAVELILNHLLDGPGEYVVVDMTAGADSFASGMFTKFDLTFLVVEPTLKSLGVYKQYQEYAREYDVRIRVIGNKVESEEDVQFLREQVGADLLTWLGRSAYVRAQEKGQYLPFECLEPEHAQALVTMKQALDSGQKDWEKLYAQTVEFHRKNALGWANASLGEDVTSQIDPAFSLAEAARGYATAS